jgi:hypothetical protein
MTIPTIDESQRKAARVVGFATLFTLPFVLYANFGIHERLIVAGNAAQTAQNIIAHQTLFRISIACDLIYSAGLVVIVAALYVILKPVGRTLALVAALWRLIYALMWIRMTLNLFDTLRVLVGAEYMQVFEADRLEALARLYLRASFDQYYVGILFWGSAATVGSYLWLKSNYIPKSLAAFGLISSAWCAATAFVFIIFPGFSNVVNLWWFDSPIGIFEIVLAFWLLFKGLRPAVMGDPDRVGIRAPL